MTTTNNTQTVITYKVERNENFGDYRVNKFLNGEWVNQRDGNWSKSKAERKAQAYRRTTKDGFFTMTDNF